MRRPACWGTSPWPAHFICSTAYWAQFLERIHIKVPQNTTIKKTLRLIKLFSHVYIARTLLRLYCTQTVPSLNHSDFQMFPNPNPIKTCVSDCVNCFTVMLSGCSKHCKLSHIFLVMILEWNAVLFDTYNLFCHRITLISDIHTLCTMVPWRSAVPLLCREINDERIHRYFTM